MIVTYNPLTRKKNFFPDFEQIKKKALTDFWKQTLQIWGESHDIIVKGIALITDDDEKKRKKKLLSNLSDRADAKYFGSVTADAITFCLFVSSLLKVKVVEKLKKEFNVVIVKKEDFLKDLEIFVRATLEEGRLIHSKTEIPPAAATPLWYGAKAGVSIRRLLRGEAALGFVYRKKAVTLGNKAKLPKALRKDTVYTWTKVTNKLVCIPRVQKQATIDIDFVEIDKKISASTTKPTIAIYMGGAGTGKTTRILADLAARNGKKFVLSWTGQNTERNKEKLRRIGADVKAETVDSFLRNTGKQYMRKYALVTGLDEELKPGDKVYIAIDELPLLPKHLLFELREFVIAATQVGIRVYILATADYEGQLKNHDYHELQEFFNPYTVIYLRTRHRPRPKREKATPVTDTNQIRKALHEGKTLIYQNRQVKRQLEKVMKKEKTKLCTQNTIKIDFSKTREELENPDIVQVTKKICNGEKLKEIGNGLYETEDGAIVAFTEEEEKENLDIPAISVLKAQGMETEKVIFIVQPLVRIAKKALHVVFTRATQVVQVAVLSLTSSLATSPPAVQT